MRIASVQHRLKKLESSGIFTPPREYPVFTVEEIYAIGQRIVNRDLFTKDEIGRLEQYSPVVGHEEIITAYGGGHIIMKRILGIDLLGGPVMAACLSLHQIA